MDPREVMEKGEPKSGRPDFAFYDRGEMGTLMQGHDWANTALGSPESWSPALRMMANFLLSNRFPQLLWWGPQFCSLYNDAYIPILGTKHPWALGQPVSEVWKEIWHVLKPLIETPFHGGPATWMEDIPLEVNRRGFVEETHFTIAYSPVPDETAANGIGGVLATVHEITDKVIGERRVHALRELGAHSAEAPSPEQACSIVAETLSAFSKDVPFLILYLLDENQQIATRTACLGVDMDDRACPESIDLSSRADKVWPVLISPSTQKIQLVDGLRTIFDAIPQGPWSDAPNTAAVVPIRSSMQNQLAGFMIVGISSRIHFDEHYRDFLELMSTQIAAMIANPRAYEKERERAEALAKLDRAKTDFFNNVSHEFRTPLTLMLGPLNEVLNKFDNLLPPEGHDQLIVARRNALRLLKLVNTLLDFSRIEADRIQAIYEPVDLPLLTSEIASVFRSAMEQAGLRFRVDCEKIGDPVYVDREMWEKIVLNLLSNAFKFTFEGEIAVRLRRVGDTVQFSVEDTGVGIREEDLQHIFERFHRIQNSPSRTHEGTGIGLSLVQELVRLHGGSVTAESKLGRGSAFRVTIPLGCAHLPEEQIEAKCTAQSLVLDSEPWIDEVRHSLSRELDNQRKQPIAYSQTARKAVIVADDNADMRDYVTRLLRQEYEVHEVSNGIAAVEMAVQLHPALILSDIMMPGLNGFGILRAIRGDPTLQSIPVILLSARAGEESSAEGPEAGADDYLVKPFTATSCFPA